MLVQRTIDRTWPADPGDTMFHSVSCFFVGGMRLRSGHHCSPRRMTEGFSWQHAKWCYSVSKGSTRSWIPHVGLNFLDHVRAGAFQNSLLVTIRLHVVLRPTETAVIFNSSRNSAAQALQGSARREAAVLVIPEDVGGCNPQSPPSLWVLLECGSPDVRSRANWVSLDSCLRLPSYPVCIRLRVGFTQDCRASRSRIRDHCMTVHSHFLVCVRSGMNEDQGCLQVHSLLIPPFQW